MTGGFGKWGLGTEGTPGQLKSSVGAGTVHVRLRDPDQRDEAERVLGRVMAAPVQRDADAFGLTVRVGTEGSQSGAAEQASRALAELAAAGVVVDDFSLGQPTLDEVFMALTDTVKEPVA